VTRFIRKVLIFCAIAFASAAFAQENTPAHRALQSFRRGVNFGNYLEAPRGQDWGMRYDERDLDNVKKEGFDHVRLPIGWHQYAEAAPEFKLEPEIFAKVDFLVTNALARGLHMIINIHHFDDFTSDPAGNTNKFYALWGQIAEHYAAQPNQLAFELLNEPKDKATTEVLNPIYAHVVSVIRQSNPSRTIFLGPSKWNSLDEVPKLKLPDDQNLIVTVHSYEPFYFTHQGASWAGASTATMGLKYPGPPATPLQPAAKAVKANPSLAKWFENYNRLPTPENPCGPKAFIPRMEKVAAWAKEHNRPIHLGEFGAYEKADRESRARYYRDMRRAAEDRGFGWAIWDWKAGFKYWSGDGPVSGMHDALFGK
jgi:endoglucanase